MISTNFTRTLVLSCLLLTASSCGESYITLAPITAATTNNFYKTEADFVNSINGAYSVLQRDGLFAQEHIFADITSDDASTISGSCAGGYCDFDNLTLTAGGTGAANILNSRWTNGYAGIYRTNVILARIAEVPAVSEAMKSRISGEAKFLRGLLYLTLTRTFGDIPLILKELELVESFEYSRESTTRIYEQIIKDLTEAAASLPVAYGNTDLGRATSGAANALLGKVYLTQKNYVEAEKVLKKVIDSNQYTLLPNYADVFSSTNGNNKEIVFAVQYKRTNGEGSPFNSWFAPENSGSAIASNPSGSLVPTIDLLESFEKGDKRVDVSIATYTYVNGTTRLYTRKYYDAGAAVRDADNDWPVLRYSDILLMYAEVRNEMKDPSGASAKLNMVRTRAGLPDKTGLSQEAMRNALAHERRVELCFEGQRWWDLIRTGAALTVMNHYFIENKISSGGIVLQMKDYNLLFPIPQDQIDINPDKIKQNTGY